MREDKLLQEKGPEYSSHLRQKKSKTKHRILIEFVKKKTQE